MVSSSQHHYTSSVSTDPDVTLERDTVDVKRPSKSPAKHPPEVTIHLLRSITSTTTCLIVHLCKKRRSIYNWNPGPRRGKEGASKMEIAGKWHVITLLEAIEYVDHEFFTFRFHVTHYGGCAVLFNKDSFYLEIKVKCVYFHGARRELPGKVMEGDQGWILQGVLSRASFRRQPLSGQKIFTVLSLYISNVYTNQRRISKKFILIIRAVMLGEHVDLIAGDVNGTAWRCSSRINISTIEEAFADCASPMPPGPTPLWGPRSVPSCWARGCGFLEPRESDQYRKARLHGALPAWRKLPPRDMASPRLRRLAQRSMRS